MTRWTAEKIEALRKMHADGFTFRQIASVLSRDSGEHVSRNAVIGKASRIGLFGAAARKREEKREVAPLPKPSPTPVTAPILAPTRFADLGNGQCRFPLTAHLDPTGPDMPCCGAPVIDRYAIEGKREATHCRYHFNAGMGDGTASERAAHKGVQS